MKRFAIGPFQIAEDVRKAPVADHRRDASERFELAIKGRPRDAENLADLTGVEFGIGQMFADIGLHPID